MKEDQNKKNQNVQHLIAQLNDLLDEAKRVGREIDATNKEAKENINDLGAKTDESIKTIEQFYSDLDQVEKETGDELDKLVLEQAEDLASE